ncbi:MAG: hypothetical protein AMXMBFR7_07650 [Planctomycetota bacterium]
MLLPYADDKPRDGRNVWVTYTLIAANVAVFLSLNPRPDFPEIVERYAFVPAYPSFETALACMFLHGSIGHLLGNMWFLHLFGDNVEARLGPLGYLLCYLLTGFGGVYGHMIFFPASEVPTIGASGAIYGVMGMYLFLFPANRIKFFYFLLILAGVTRLPAIVAMIFFFGQEVLFGYFAAARQIEGGVGHLAHAGGFLTGFGLAGILTVTGLIRDDGGNVWAWLTGRGRRPRDEVVPDAPALEPVVPGGCAEDLLGLVRARRIPEAQALWRSRGMIDRTCVLPPPEQLVLALDLAERGDAEASRAAFTRLLEHHPHRQPYAAEAHLGIARDYLIRLRAAPSRAYADACAEHLRQAAAWHPDPQRQQLARLWLSTLPA